MDPLLAAYLTTTFVLAVTPGATTAVVVRNTLAQGARGGLAAAAGAATGNTIQALVAALGVAVIFTRWPAAATVLRIGGGAYLFWLGINSVRKALINSSRFAFPGSASTNREKRTGKSLSPYRQGLTVNLLNPAITSFYLIVVPSFIPRGAPRWYYAMLAAAHIVIAFLCHSTWMVAIERLRRGAERPRLTRGLELVTGVVLMALAIKVMASGK